MDRLLDVSLLVVEIAILFLVVTVAVQLLQARFGAQRLRAWMGGSSTVAALKGIVLGFVTPFCTFTAVPMLVGMRQAGVPVAGYVAFIVAAPVLDPVLFGALAIIVGLKTALVYTGIASVAAIGLALAAERANIERWLAPVELMFGLSGESRACDTGCAQARADENWSGWRVELSGATQRATSLLAGMTPVLLVGIGLSVVIEAAVPPGVTERLTSASPSFSVPVAAALGTPLYVSTTVFVPIAESLQAAGVGVGAIVALTIAGAGANLPELVVLSKLARPQLIGTFFTYVFGVAVLGGLLAQIVIG